MWPTNHLPPLPFHKGVSNIQYAFHISQCMVWSASKIKMAFPEKLLNISQQILCSLSSKYCRTFLHTTSFEIMKWWKKGSNTYKTQNFVSPPAAMLKTMLWNYVGTNMHEIKQQNMHSMKNSSMLNHISLKNLMIWNSKSVEKLSLFKFWQC